MLIYKYNLGGIRRNVNEVIYFRMSDGDILSAQNQNENICIWAQDTGSDYRNRGFMVIPTEEEIHFPSWYAYIGTVQMGEGQIVLHVYEVGSAN
jgi:hypothetical protein